MHIDYKTFIVIFLVCSCLVAGIYMLHLRRFKRRASYDRKDMLRGYGVDDKDYDFLARILSTIGECYRIDYRKLRPTDAFDGNLSHADSWVLDAGNEKLSDAMLNFGLTEQDKAQTIKELVDICFQRSKEKPV